MQSAGPLNSVITNFRVSVRLVVWMMVLNESSWEIIHSTIWSRGYEPLRIFRNAAFSVDSPAPPPMTMIVSSTEQLRVWNIWMVKYDLPISHQFLSTYVKGNVTSSMSTAPASTEPSAYLNPFLSDQTKSEGRRNLCCWECNFYKTEWDMKEFLTVGSSAQRIPTAVILVF
jgi:hypothetical protein